MIHIGFTGTRKGMSSTQLVLLNRTLDNIAPPLPRRAAAHSLPVPTRTPETVTVHHGACLGADEQFHKLALSKGYRICIHPTDEIFIRSTTTRMASPSLKQAASSTPESLRYATQMDPSLYMGPNVPPEHLHQIVCVLPARPPMKRNDDILDHSDMLIAAPDFGSENRLRSGSWATIRHAKKRHMMMRILFPELMQNDSYGTG